VAVEAVLARRDARVVQRRNEAEQRARGEEREESTHRGWRKRRDEAERETEMEKDDKDSGVREARVKATVEGGASPSNGRKSEQAGW